MTVGFLLPTVPIGAAVTAIIGETYKLPKGVRSLTVLADFTHGSDGTDVTVFVQTSLDDGLTWIDIMAFNFTTSSARAVSAVRSSVALAAAITPTDGTLTDDTILDGLIGDRLRTKMTTTGTYVSTTLSVSVVPN